MDERRKKKGIYFLPNLSATSAQGLLIYNHFNRPCNEVEPMFMGLWLFRIEIFLYVAEGKEFAVTHFAGDVNGCVA